MPLAVAGLSYKGHTRTYRSLRFWRRQWPGAPHPPPPKPQTRSHPPTTHTHTPLQRARANDQQLHTDKTMFSCGSLAPKLQRGGSCMDHGFARWVGWGRLGWLD